MSPSTSAKVVIQVVSGTDTETIERAVELGNTARKTLGLLPRAAYFDAAQRGWLLAALDEGEMIGYTVFRLPRNEVTLVHLCVAKDYRHRGMAQRLVNEVSRRHQARLGVRAKCRDDYADIQRVWRGLGFEHLGRARGRGEDQAAMTVWWLDHGHANLFTPLEEPTELAVAIDVNILMDLRTRKDHPQADRSQVLLAPDVADRIEKVVPHGLERDLDRHPAALRGRLVDAAARYRRPHGSPKRAEELYEILRATVRSAEPDRELTPQDIGDLWQLAETAAARIRVFLTWDERLRTKVAPLLAQLNQVPELTGLRVIDPDHLVIQLDELAHAVAYRPQVIAGSSFSTELANAQSEAALMAFLDRAAGETRQELKARLQALARSPRSHSIVRAGNDKPVGCYASVLDGHVLRAPLLRVQDNADADTMARYLLWMLRVTARDENVSVVRIEDPYLSPAIERAASHEGYQRIDGVWHSWVIQAAGTGAQISAAVSSAHALVDLEPAALLPPHLAPESAAQYERTWWPAKITDSDLAHFAVAIQPRWSAELLGEPPILTERSTRLALGREHVYYRGNHPSVLKAPGRVLWYLTQDSNTGPARFIGTSLLDAIEFGAPEELHAQFAHYGVFTLSDVRGAAGERGSAQALRVSYTELFRRPVLWSEYLDILKSLEGPKRIQGPVRVPPATFAAIYAAGNTTKR
ncbi:GNAT family N-acetyltransferase [Lentzea albidocapillata]|uniref:Acetyltransferase (GNAT) domain-containing protein n=1 Tax=Lentzea albidocapillata TaxID=40571 RepID=A0A1W2FV97_9PSEU|nr:GNAT family N-acetyltransferase [Lentzea albidocapillata]SMD25566.1 Acetyltransferase (GNAT) domain-containing protein [Lentzea albidocapillata]